MKFEEITRKSDIPFGEPVLIFQQRSSTPYVGIAVLDKIDAAGHHWCNVSHDVTIGSLHVWGSISDFANVKPTHWSRIWLPGKTMK